MKHRWLGPWRASFDSCTNAATKMGVIMGTAAYMSPEQARGKTVDKRADIWAFGIVLYEMLTGKQVFAGEDISLTLSQVLQSDPDWSALPERISGVNSYLRRCLEKDPKQRIRDIGDVRLALDGAFDRGGSSTADAAVVPLAQPARWQRPIPALLTVVAVAAVAGLAVWNLRTPPPQPVVRFPVVLPAGQLLSGGRRHEMALSQAGRNVLRKTRAEGSVWVYKGN